MYEKLGNCWIINDWSDVTEDECNKRLNNNKFKPFNNDVNNWLLN